MSDAQSVLDWAKNLCVIWSKISYQKRTTSPDWSGWLNIPCGSIRLIRHDKCDPIFVAHQAETWLMWNSILTFRTQSLPVSSADAGSHASCRNHEIKLNDIYEISHSS